MRQIINWLMQDDQKDLYEFIFAFVLNILFLALAGLLLWPLDRLTLAVHWAKGYGILWIVVGVTVLLVNRIQGFFRVNIYDHPDAYVISNLAVSCLLQVGWSAFAALSLHSFVTGAPAWIAAILYLFGILSCLIAFFAVSSCYRGHIYKLVSLPLALVGFLVFSVWPG